MARWLTGGDFLGCKSTYSVDGYRPNNGNLYTPPNCQSPKSDKEDDLCQQWRMAEAAEESGCINRWQSLIGLLGLGGLLATVIYAARSAQTSAIAANAAKDSVAVAQDTARRELRAYVTVRGGHIRAVTNASGSWHIAWQIEIFNSGQTPAYNFSTRHRGGVFSFFEGQPPDLTLGEIEGASILAPQQSAFLDGNLPVSQIVIEGLRRNSWRIHINGRADFTDVFKEKRYFTFECCRGSHAGEDIWGIGPTERGYDAN